MKKRLKLVIFIIITATAILFLGNTLSNANTNNYNDTSVFPDSQYISEFDGVTWYCVNHGLTFTSGTYSKSKTLESYLQSTYRIYR